MCTEHYYYMVNKPSNMVSQFISSHNVPLLGNLDFNFAAGTHAIGRLDKPSEGLLLLTTDTTITNLLFHSGTPHPRIYLVMVKNVISDSTVQLMQQGLVLPSRQKEGNYTTLPCLVEKITTPTLIYPYATDPREAYPHSWLRIILTQGKYRQIRKMCSAVHHHCMRLIRVGIQDMALGATPPGTVVRYTKPEFFEKLQLTL